MFALLFSLWYAFCVNKNNYLDFDGAKVAAEKWFESKLWVPSDVELADAVVLLWRGGRFEDIPRFVMNRGFILRSWFEKEGCENFSLVSSKWMLYSFQDDGVPHVETACIVDGDASFEDLKSETVAMASVHHEKFCEGLVDDGWVEFDNLDDPVVPIVPT